MAQEGAADPGKFQESFRNRHQKEADRLRNEIVELVKQAKVLLHGQEPRSRLPPRPTYGKRADRESQLEATLEKANWYRHEIKKLRRDLESWDRVCGGPAIGSAAQDRDPMETYNLLVERRKELQRLQRNGQGLDRVAAAQRRAEAEQNALSPEIEDRLRRAKDEFELQKRLNIRLQADRQKVAALRKVAEQEVRAANSQLKSRAAQLQRPPRAPAHPAGYGGAESKQMKQLRRDVDILSEAVRQDNRKHNVAERDDEAQLDHTRGNVAKLMVEVSAHETEIRRLQAEMRGEEASGPIGGLNEILPPCAEGLPSFVNSGFQPTDASLETERGRGPGSVEAEPEPEVCGLECLEVCGPVSLAAEDAEEADDDMAALVAPSQEAAPFSGESPADSQPQVSDTAALLQRAGASLAEASLSGLMGQKLEELRQETEAQQAAASAEAAAA